MPSIPERFLWATELLNIKQNQNILEIGCGVGILAECIADQLTTGKFVAVDKSASMLKKARARNKRHIDRGTSEFVGVDFAKAILQNSTFDIIVAFNVNFFWKDSSKELSIIRKTLKENGKLFVFCQLPYDVRRSAAEPIRTKLRENGFEIIDIGLKKLFPTSAFCVVARATDSHLQR
jgi:ubiquinone/menaquinone biosynthesis C-methylase UbiE